MDEEEQHKELKRRAESEADDAKLGACPPPRGEDEAADYWGGRRPQQTVSTRGSPRKLSAPA
eukprot:11609927-Alexandrium_andersonii.AAC.1